MSSAQRHFVLILVCLFGAANPQFSGSATRPVPEEKFKDIPVDFYLHICEEMDFTNAYFLVERESFSVDNRKFERYALEIYKHLERHSVRSDYFMVSPDTKDLSSLIVGVPTLFTAYFILATPQTTNSVLKQADIPGLHLKILDRIFLTFWHLYQILDLNSGLSLYIYLAGYSSSAMVPEEVLALNSKIFPFSPPRNLDGDAVQITITEVYEPGPGVRKDNVYGLWSDIAGLTVEFPLIWERRMDLTGVKIRAASVASPPQQIIKRKLPSGQIEMDGIMFEIFQTIQSTLNFTYTIVESIDGQYGVDETSGMIGMLARGEIDIAIADFNPSATRNAAATWLKGLRVFFNQVYFKASAADGSWTTYFKSFVPEGWYVFGATVAVTMTVMIATYIISMRYHSVGRDAEDFDGFDISGSCLQVYGALCQQGAPNEPQRDSTRLAFLWVFILSLVCYNSYAAFLTSFLAVKEVPLPFNRLSQMYKTTKFKYGTVAGTAIEPFLKSFDPDGSGRMVKERYQSVPTLDAGLKKIMTDPEYAFVWAPSSVDFLLKNGDDACAVSTIGPTYKLLPSSISMFVQKKSPFTDIINFYLEKMSESGQLDRIFTRWLVSTAPACAAGGGTDDLTLTLGEVRTPFASLASGMVLAFLALVAEYAYRVCCCIRPGTDQVHRERIIGHDDTYYGFYY